MLLQYVYDNKICHPLLQPRPEAEMWNEALPYSSQGHPVLGGVEGRYSLGYRLKLGVSYLGKGI